MSEKRKKNTTILLKIQGKTVKLELFPASQWGGPDGAFRLRLEGCWHAPGGERHQYYFPGGIAGVVTALVTGDAPDVAPQPPFRRGDRVAAPTGRFDLEGSPTFEVTWLVGAPILAVDGRWWGPVVGRNEPVALDTLRGRK